MPDKENRELAISVTLAAVVAFTLLDFAIPRIANSMRGEVFWMVGVVFGFFPSQAMVIAIWAVFAPVNVVLRMSCWFLFGMMMWYVLVIAIMPPPHQINSVDSVAISVLVLSGVTLLQIPLWIAKLALRFRIIRPGELPTPIANERLQFQLKDLLIATVILAVALSPIRLFLPKEHIELPPRLFQELFISVPVASAFILVGALPSLWAAFVSRPVVVPATALAIYGLVITVIEVAVFSAFMRPRGGPSIFVEAFGVFFVGNIVQCGIIFTLMRMYRDLGFRLQRVPRRAAPLPVNTASQHAEEISSPQNSTDAN